MRFNLIAVAVAGLVLSLPLCAATLPHDGDRALRTLLDRGKATHSATVEVWQDGKEIGHYYPGNKAPGPIELMSVTKSVVALAIGQLVSDGRIKSLDQPIADFYPEWRQGSKKDITVRMVMSHTSGLQDQRATTAEVYPAPDAIQLALAAELSNKPGTSFFYSNKAVNLLAGVIEKASGAPVDVFLRDGLFKAMDIHPGNWEKDKAGHPYAMAGLPLTATDLAKLGQLVNQHGQWQGKQLISNGYMDEMLRPGDNYPETLLWWNDPTWRHFDPNPDMPSMLRKAGVPEDTVSKLASGLRNARFDNIEAMMAGVYKALGPDGKDILADQLIGRGIGPYRLFKLTASRTFVYSGNGDGGQYVVVIPAANLVAVRQIDAENDQEQEGEGYEDFVDRVVALAEAEGRIAAPGHE